MEQPSRGPFGALTALLNAKGFVASLGPLLVLVSLAFETSMQQALAVALPTTAVPVITALDLTHDDVLPSGRASTYTTQSMNSTHSGLIAALAGLDPTSRSSVSYNTTSSCINSHAVSPPSGSISVSNTSAHQSSSPYFTISLCAECSNVTSEVYKNITYDAANVSIEWWTLPSGTYIDGTTTYFTVGTPLGWGDYGAIVNDTIVGLEAMGSVFCAGAVPCGEIDAVAAHRCTIKLCAPVYELQYDGNSVNEIQIAQLGDFTSEMNGSLQLRYDNDLDMRIQTDLLNTPSVTQGLVTNTSLSVLKQLFTNLLTGSLLETEAEGPDNLFETMKGEPSWKLLYSALRLNESSMVEIDDWLVGDGVWETCNNDFETNLNIVLRAAMAEIRNSYGTLLSLDHADPNKRWDLTRPFYRVRWGWVVFPVILEAISIAFWMRVVRVQVENDVPLWKNSSLAVMFHGIEPTQYEEGMAAEKISEMDAVAKTIKVRLAYTKLGYRLVGMEEEV